APADGRDERHFVAVVECGVRVDVAPVDGNQAAGGAEGGDSLGELGEQVGDTGAVVELARQLSRAGGLAEAGEQAHADPKPGAGVELRHRSSIPSAGDGPGDGERGLTFRAWPVAPPSAHPRV